MKPNIREERSKNAGNGDKCIITLVNTLFCVLVRDEAHIEGRLVFLVFFLRRGALLVMVYGQHGPVDVFNEFLSAVVSIKQISSCNWCCYNDLSQVR